MKPRRQRSCPILQKYSPYVLRVREPRPLRQRQLPRRGSPSQKRWLLRPSGKIQTSPYRLQLLREIEPDGFRLQRTASFRLHPLQNSTHTGSAFCSSLLQKKPFACSPQSWCRCTSSRCHYEQGPEFRRCEHYNGKSSSRVGNRNDPRAFSNIPLCRRRC